LGFFGEPKESSHKMKRTGEDTIPESMTGSAAEILFAFSAFFCG
jgi:hypothetical protein